MGKLVISEFLSLDGVMEGPGPEDSFALAGWTMGYKGEGFNELKHKELLDAGALLMGQITYEGFAQAWPKMAGDGGFGDLMNNLPKYVVSTSLKAPTWNNSHVISENIVSEIQKLKQSIDKNILVFGSANLAKTLFENNLVDDVYLLVHPIVLGQGKKLFKDGESIRLQLVEATTLKPDLVLLHYAVEKK